MASAWKPNRKRPQHHDGDPFHEYLPAPTPKQILLKNAFASTHLRQAHNKSHYTGSQISTGSA